MIIGVPLLAIFLWYVQTPGQVLLEPHQVARIMSFLHPENYADSTALQTSNSIMAIGSGGLFGKGFGSNTISNVSASDVNLVSENQTDFIFSVIGEEFGFVGCVILIVIFACLVYQMYECGEEIRKSDRYLCCCGSCLLYGISVIYQHSCCDRNYAEYRTATSVYQLWVKLVDVGIDCDRNGT